MEQESKQPTIQYYVECTNDDSRNKNNDDNVAPEVGTSTTEKLNYRKDNIRRRISKRNNNSKSSTAGSTSKYNMNDNVVTTDIADTTAEGMLFQLVRESQLYAGAISNNNNHDYWNGGVGNANDEYDSYYISNHKSGSNRKSNMSPYMRTIMNNVWIDELYTVMSQLIRYKRSIVHAVDGFGNTPLHVVCSNPILSSNLKILRLLIETSNEIYYNDDDVANKDSTSNQTEVKDPANKNNTMKAPATNNKIGTSPSKNRFSVSNVISSLTSVVVRRKSRIRAGYYKNSDSKKQSITATITSSSSSTSTKNNTKPIHNDHQNSYSGMVYSIYKMFGYTRRRRSSTRHRNSRNSNCNDYFNSEMTTTRRIRNKMKELKMIPRDTVFWKFPATTTPTSFFWRFWKLRVHHRSCDDNCKISSMDNSNTDNNTLAASSSSSSSIIQPVPGAIVRMRSNNGATALHRACQNSANTSIHSIEYLIECNPSAVCIQEKINLNLPLHYVCLACTMYETVPIEIVIRLLQQWPESCQVHNSNGNVPLHLAVRITNERTRRDHYYYQQHRQYKDDDSVFVLDNNDNDDNAVDDGDDDTSGSSFLHEETNILLNDLEEFSSFQVIETTATTSSITSTATNTSTSTSIGTSGTNTSSNIEFRTHRHQHQEQSNNSITNNNNPVMTSSLLRRPRSILSLPGLNSSTISSAASTSLLSSSMTPSRNNNEQQEEPSIGDATDITSCSSSIGDTDCNQKTTTFRINHNNNNNTFNQRKQQQQQQQQREHEKRYTSSILSSSQLDIIKILIDYCPLALFIPNNNGHTPIHIAMVSMASCGQSQHPVVDVLRECMQKYNVSCRSNITGGCNKGDDPDTATDLTSEEEQEQDRVMIQKEREQEDNDAYKYFILKQLPSAPSIVILPLNDDGDANNEKQDSNDLVISEENVVTTSNDGLDDNNIYPTSFDCEPIPISVITLGTNVDMCELETQNGFVRARILL